MDWSKVYSYCERGADNSEKFGGLVVSKGELHWRLPGKHRPYLVQVFLNDRPHRFTLPLDGGGQGWGWCSSPAAVNTPLPNPPPQGGRENLGWC